MKKKKIYTGGRGLNREIREERIRSRRCNWNESLNIHWLKKAGKVRRVGNSHKSEDLPVYYMGIASKEGGYLKIKRVK